MSPQSICLYEQYAAISVIIEVQSGTISTGKLSQVSVFLRFCFFMVISRPVFRALVGTVSASSMWNKHPISRVCHRHLTIGLNFGAWELCVYEEGPDGGGGWQKYEANHKMKFD